MDILRRDSVLVTYRARDYSLLIDYFAPIKEGGLDEVEFKASLF